MSISKSIRILVAEDDLPTRVLLLENLRSLGFDGEILEADNGMKAYKIFIDEMNQNRKIDFIISDMVMPVTTGYEFLNAVRATELYKSIPFLMLTSKNDRDIVFKCIKAGVSNYLIKPWNLQGLGEKIHACWEKHNS